MNNERYNQIIDEAYENYSKSLIGSITFSERYKHFRVDGLEFNSGYPNYMHFTKEEFINKCKTDTEFSEKWKLKIEERCLSWEERDFPVLRHSTKLITVTYKDEKIEVYES